MNALRSLKALGRPFSVYAAAAVFSALLPCAGTAAPLKLHTNQEMIDDLLRPNDLDAKTRTRYSRRFSSSSRPR